MNAVRLLIGLLLSAGTPSLALAQSAQDFYKGRQILLMVGHEVGKDYDVGARLLARHLPKHLPGQPAVVVQNMPQAAGLANANFMYLRAPRDGGVIGSISRNLPNQAVMGLPNIEADARRYNWLGATSFPGRVCAVGTNAPVKSVAEVFTT